MSFIAASASSFLVRNREPNEDIRQMITQMHIGIGGSISAISGLKIVEKRAKRLQIPKTLEDTCEGKYSAFTI